MSGDSEGLRKKSLKQITRREFLKFVALVSGGLGFSSLASSFSWVQLTGDTLRRDESTRDTSGILIGNSGDDIRIESDGSGNLVFKNDTDGTKLVAIDKSNGELVFY